ncbi:MAG: hypothetical protein R3C13_03005 [Hyphomonas sp.]|uniref:hypothetical protein n=1 Tax=Hyphomonas sp. TaxID=87 RepID=UPI003527A96E
MMRHLVLGSLAGLATMPAGADPASPLDSPAVAAALNAASLPMDACGGEDLLDVAVPDGIFLQACKLHDSCYRSGALDQGTCDTLFLDRMREACDATFDPYEKPLIHATCRVGAAIYYTAVNSRFGAMLYPGGHTGGEMLNSLQTRLAEPDGSDELSVCTDVANTSDRQLQYLLVLHDAKGHWVDTEPDLGKVVLNPGKTKKVCLDTDHAPWASWDSVGPAYAVTLLVDDPDRLTPFGDLIPLDRLECDKASGECRHAEP